MRRPGIEALVEGPLDRVSPTVKVFWALLMLFGVAAIPIGNTALLVVPAAMLAAVMIVGRIPLLLVVSRVAVLFPFAAAASLLAVFHPAGWFAVLTVLLRSALSIAVLVVLMATTSFVGIIEVFRRVHLPGVLVTTIALMYRYVFVLIKETERMKAARESRLFREDRRRLWLLRGGVIGHLAIRSFERAERIFAAMRSRGWT